MDQIIRKTLLLCLILVTFWPDSGLSYPHTSKLTQTGSKYRKQAPSTVAILKKETILFPVKSKVLCSDFAKCKDTQENGIRVKKQLNFNDKEDTDASNKTYDDKDPSNRELNDYDDLEAQESRVRRWKRSLLGRIFGYPSGHYRRRWWPARRHNHHQHRYHHHDHY